MADFEPRFTAGATLEPWTDPLVGTRPSRLNPAANRPHQRRRVVSGALVSVSARVGGVTAPLDAALGGRLFVAWFVEYPSVSPPALSSPAGQSSLQRFTPTTAGHYTLVLRRAGGGGVLLHFDVVVT